MYSLGQFLLGVLYLGLIVVVLATFVVVAPPMLRWLLDSPCVLTVVITTSGLVALTGMYRVGELERRIGMDEQLRKRMNANIAWIVVGTGIATTLAAFQAGL